ncbi:hypothetical protein TFLX_06229 [Thermoflexales bacterium]|nr:hypothetical protein TFLX_06229 [Thermoflexales bacterium]
MDISRQYVEASIKTANDLRTIAHSVTLRELSQLSLPEIDAVVDLVAQVIPAGNVPGVILSGLARLPGRHPPLKTIYSDIQLLFKGVEQVLDTAIYGTFFAGPAAVIWGYQNLLKLAGKDPEDSFPEGTWQFYVDYALRDDTARHSNETHGFDTILNQHQIRLSPVDRITAWVMAAIHCLHQYDALLENEWRERTFTSLLREITRDEPDAGHYARLYRNWEAQRPYGRGSDAAVHETYPLYRRAKFDHFLAAATRELRADLRRQWQARIQAAVEQDLPAYQRQMSILAYLVPGAYGETRSPISLQVAHIGVVYQGRYYLIPTCLPGAEQPVDVLTVRAQIAALLDLPAVAPPAQLIHLAQAKRSALPGVRNHLSSLVIADWDALRSVPILLNCDRRSRPVPLSELRQAERGIGDQALTVFDTGETLVFDQSHIFFDGAWGAALAEILTSEALSWAVYLNTLPPAQPDRLRLRPLAFPFQPAELALIQSTSRVATETSAESEGINSQAILELRQLFKQRNDLLQLTVNDLLVLYRAVHAVTYRPAPDLIAELQGLAQQDTTREPALAALEMLTPANQTNPAILIPVDASQRFPRDRLYPMSFEVPLGELDFLNLQQQVLEALKAYRAAKSDRAKCYVEFDRQQRVYLATLAGFGAILSKTKEMALTGASVSVGTIKLLAHMPTPLQRLLDKVPSRFDVLNDIIKGREVFSNVGAVARTSTLTRFNTAKDDNAKKTLAWGVITTAEGVMHVSLRDFRPHVGLLAAAGLNGLAHRICRDYLDTYVHGLNAFLRDVRTITLASRETHLAKPADQP